MSLSALSLCVVCLMTEVAWSNARTSISEDEHLWPELTHQVCTSSNNLGNTIDTHNSCQAQARPYQVGQEIQSYSIFRVVRRDCYDKQQYKLRLTRCLSDLTSAEPYSLQSAAHSYYRPDIKYPGL